MSKNLTGTKRIVYDCCIDLYNFVQKWKSLTSSTHTTITAICVLKQKELPNGDCEDYTNEEISEDVFAQLQSLSDELIRKFEGLESVMDKMSKLLKKLKSISALSDLEQSRNASSEVNLDQVFFQAWPLSRFNECIEEIERMYRKEFNVKSSITKEICTLSKKSALVFFEACWKYEPNINTDRVNEILGGIISELELFAQLS